MGHRFAEIAFTESVREVQRAHGSRDDDHHTGYAAMHGGEDYNHRLGAGETAFIAERDSFYMASVSQTGWPYVQHRGGPAGFLRVLGEQTLGFADFSGNRQYISTGNLRRDERIALFLMDYPKRTRLKLLGRARLVGDDQPQLLAQLEMDDYRARVERGWIIRIEAFDWNCPQHITPRFSQARVDQLMASLIEENRALKATQTTPAAPQTLGGGPLELEISALRQLTPRVRGYELRDPHGAELPPFAAGAHLSLPLRLADGSLGSRRYSICSDPARRDVYQIAVLREERDGAGSQSLHRQFGLGLRLRCPLPRNDFTLHADRRPAVLIAGGIGITPIKAMIHSLQARGGDLQLHYAGRSAAQMAFCDQLPGQLGERISLYRADRGERMDLRRLLRDAPHDAVFYACGPARLIDALLGGAAALGIDPARLRIERFAAAGDADARPLQLELRRSGLRLRVGARQSLLDAMLEAGVDAPYGCRVGNCKSCALRVLEGEPEHRDSALSTAERDAQGLICPCVSRARGGHLSLDI